MKILVAEQSRTLAISLAGLLAQTSHEVDVAYDGVQALDRLRTTPYEVVIAEMNLPRIGAQEVLRRAAIAGVQVHSIGLLSKSVVDMEDLADGYGMDVLLPKPFDSGALLALLPQLVAPRDESCSTRMGYWQRRLWQCLCAQSLVTHAQLQEVLQSEMYGSVFSFVRSINYKLSQSGSRASILPVADKGYKVVGL